jgi:hypothetical protein
MHYAMLNTDESLFDSITEILFDDNEFDVIQCLVSLNISILKIYH